MAGLTRRAIRTAQLGAMIARERRLPWGRPERLERIQAARVREIVAHAYESVPYYREAMDARGLRPADFRDVRDLSRLPVLTSDELRADVERFTSTRIPVEERDLHRTSGTVGDARGLVYWDRDFMHRTLVTAERDRAVISALAGERRGPAALREMLSGGMSDRPSRMRLADPAAGHQRISIFPSDFTVRRMRARWNEETLIPRRSAHHHYLHAFTTPDEAAARFEEVRPRVVFSFGSYADQFLRYADARGDVFLPMLWVIGGDCVTGEGRALAARLGVALLSVYSAVETDRLGFQCERLGGHHLNTDICHVRIADGDGRDLPLGESGDVIVSNLLNRATVVLNYRIGDRGTLDPAPCPCGRTLPLLASFDGRVTEHVRLRDGREVSAMTLHAMFGRQLFGSLKTQVTQRAPGQLRWRVVPRPDADAAALRAAVIERAREVLPDDDVDVELVDDIERTERGKHRAAVVEEHERQRLG
jgi:phenylacetate-CoA ligase